MAANSQRPCIGFDFGGAYLKMALTDKKGVQRMIVTPMPEGVTKEGEIIDSNAMSIFLRDTLKKNRVHVKECAFVLPASRSLFHRVSIPVMQERQIRANLPFEFQDFIGDKVKNYYFDYSIAEVKRNDAGEATGLELMAVACNKEFVESYIHFFKKIGLKPCVTAPLECAFSNIIRHYETWNPDVPEGEDYCFLDLGHGATRMHIYNGPLYEASRVIESGAALIDAAIAKDMSMSLAEARTYKESSQEATRNLREASSAYSSIALEIRKAIMFYNSSNPQREIKRIYCCGGGVRMTPLLDAIKEAVGIQLHNAAELLPPVRSDQESIDMCTTAVGITLQ